MLHLEIEEYASWRTMKCAAALAAMAVLAGCAVAVPLRPLLTSSQSSLDGDVACTANPKCPNGRNHGRIAYHRLQPVSGKFDDGPPDFIAKNEDEEDMRR